RIADLIEGGIAGELRRKQRGIETVGTGAAELEGVGAEAVRGAVDDAAGRQRQRVAAAEEIDRDARSCDGAGVEDRSIAERRDGGEVSRDAAVGIVDDAAAAH